MEKKTLKTFININLPNDFIRSWKFLKEVFIFFLIKSDKSI